MTDNVTLNPGTGGDAIAADDLTTLNGSAVSGVKAQRVKVGFGADAALTDVSSTNPLPVSLDAATLSALENTTVTVSNLPATQDVSGTVELGATSLSALENVNATVSGSVSVSNFPSSTTITGSVEVSNDAGNPLPVAAASLPLPSGAATESTLAAISAKLPTLQTSAPDAGVAAMPTREVGQDTITVSFIRSGSGLLTDKMTQRRLGSGMAVSQASGALVLTTGTTTNSEFLARTISTFRDGHIASFEHLLSQRIVNQNFYCIVADLVGEGLSCTINSATSITVMAPNHGLISSDAGESMFVGAINGAAGVPGYYAIASVPDGNTLTFTVAGWPASGSCTVDLFGRNHIKVLYNGATATSALFSASRNGWTTADTSITTNTSASPGHLVQWKLDGRNVYVGDMLVASGTTPNLTTRGFRVGSVPDDQTPLYLYLWAFNGTTAPASTTTWTVNQVCVEDFANLPVFIAGNRMQGTEPPMPVQVTSGTVTTVSTVSNVAAIAAGANAIGDVGFQYRANATGAASVVSALSPATPAFGTIKSSAGRLIGWQLQNSSSGVRSVKIFNATAPTLGTTAATFEIDIPAGGRSDIQLPGGIGFATAITWSATSAKGLTDNTATGLAANDVSGAFFYA